ncbi:MAG: T9SS type A sorting domain-containing protein [Bacteroidota bacterium]
MKNLTASNRLFPPFNLVPYLFLALFAVPLNGQTLHVTQLNGHTMGFYVTGIADQDLVYYRFSDGYYTVKVADEIENPDAMVKRSSSEPLLVSAYVAKKNGPIKYAGAVSTENTSSNGTIPDVLMGDDNLLRVSTSWSPFFETGGIEDFSDNSLLPPLQIPGGQSWYFLNLTVQNPNPDTDFPGEIRLEYENNVFTIENALFGQRQIKSDNDGMFPFTTITSLNGVTDIWSVDETTLRVGVNIPAGVKQVHVQLVVSGVPSQGFSSMLKAGLFDDKNVRLDKDELDLVANAYPYDPNGIMGYNTFRKICAYSDEVESLRFRAYFQNEGKGDAIRVAVNVRINPDVLDGYSVDNIKSSHPTPTFEYDQAAGILTFGFLDINLPGLQAEPAPLLQDTKGWVDFTINTNECIEGEGCFLTTGEVIFYGINDFIQITPFETEVKHYVAKCNETTSCTVPVVIPQITCEEDDSGPNVDTDLDFHDPIIPFIDDNGDLSTGGQPRPLIVSSLPTVFGNSFNVKIQTEHDDEPVTIMITNLVGAPIFYQNQMLPALYEATFWASDWEPGMYLLTARQGTEIETIKIIKQ